VRLSSSTRSSPWNSLNWASCSRAAASSGDLSAGRPASSEEAPESLPQPASAQASAAAPRDAAAVVRSFLGEFMRRGSCSLVVLCPEAVKGGGRGNGVCGPDGGRPRGFLGGRRGGAPSGEGELRLREVIR